MTILSLIALKIKTDNIQEFMGEETALEKLFKSMDKDGDGTVTKEVIVIVTVIINIFTTHAYFYAPMTGCIKNLNLKVYICFYCSPFIYEYLSR